MTSPLHHGLPDAQSWIGQLIGNYRLVRLLGEGGMGMVFEAVHDGVGGKAAIKILRPEISMQANLAARFFNEARAANAIQHPGIVRVFDCGYTQNRAAYLTMEFLAGESLRSRLERAIRLPVPDVTRIGRQIASALVASHRTGIVHRDAYEKTMTCFRVSAKDTHRRRKSHGYSKAEDSSYLPLQLV